MSNCCSAERLQCRPNPTPTLTPTPTPHQVRRVEKAMRDWIFRLRLRKWRAATTRIVSFLSSTGHTTLVCVVG